MAKTNRYSSTGLSYEEFLKQLRQELDAGRLSMADLQEMYNTAGVEGTPERTAIVNLYNELIVDKNKSLNQQAASGNYSAPNTLMFDNFLKPHIQQQEAQKNNADSLLNTQISSPQNVLEHMYTGNSSAKNPFPATRTDAFGATTDAAGGVYDTDEAVTKFLDQLGSGGVNLSDVQKAYNAVLTNDNLSPSTKNTVLNYYNNLVDAGRLDPNKNYAPGEIKEQRPNVMPNEDIMNKISSWNKSGRGTIEGKDYYNPYYDYEKKPSSTLRVGFREGGTWLGNLLNVDVNDYSVDALRNTLNAYSPETADFVNNLTDGQLENILKENAATDTGDYGINKWILGDRKYFDLQSAITDLQQLAQIEDMPTRRSREEIVDEIYGGKNKEVEAYLADLQEATNRNTEMMQQQLNENQLAFDDYRSNVLSNQYQQNAQLMGQVGSEMSKARRNALEAGASAGLRMAENINTTLAMQNKQSQLSLETSNQLAQQLLNQRQASSGIRSNYNQMLNDNASEARQYKANAVDKFDEIEQSRYNDAYDKWSSQMDSVNNQFGDDYRAYKTNKTNSVYS